MKDEQSRLTDRAMKRLLRPLRRRWDLQVSEVADPQPQMRLLHIRWRKKSRDTNALWNALR